MSASQGGIRAIVGTELASSMDALMSGIIRPLVRRAAIPGGSVNPSGRRFCILHLDGVSRDVLFSAVKRGYAPFLGRLIRSREFVLSSCYSGAPASTPAFQAGLLYGARDADIPSFLWYDRARAREMHMDRAEDAAAVEASLKLRGEGLMRNGSTSFSVFAGGAAVNGYSMAGWASDRVQLIRGWDRWHLAAGAVAHSLTAARVVGRLITEGGSALYDLFRQSALVGRLQHEPTFLVHRMALAIGARETATFGAVLDIASGVPALYICFGDYDEIAHRRGPESRLALLALWGIDRAIARIFAAAAAQPQMAYDLYVLADHGQVATRPFEEVTRLTLADYLALALPARQGGVPRISEEAVRRIGRLRAFDRAAQALPASLEARARQATLEAARTIAFANHDSESLRVLDELTCIDAGDVAHLYLGREKRPLDLAEIKQRYPRVLQVITHCPSVGIVAVRNGRSATAFFRGQRIDLGEPAQVRELALGYRSDQVAEFLTAMMRLPSAGDLVAYGNGLPGEDVAFAWEFGSHAGVGRREVETFIIHPAGASFDFAGVKHGADLHEFFVNTYFKPSSPPLTRPKPSPASPRCLAF